MAKILQLEDFGITKLHIDWYPLNDAIEDKETSIETEISVSYNVRRHKEKTNTFVLELSYSYSPSDKAAKQGYEIHADIMGLFHFPEGAGEAEMQALIRINGGTILYGILRGEIASFTGSFPSGKLVLPTIYMPEIVATIESQKRGEMEKGQPKVRGKAGKSRKK